MSQWYCSASHRASSHIRQCFVCINELIFKSLMSKAFVDWLLSKVHLHKRDRFTNHLKLIIPVHQLSMQYIVVCKVKSAQKVLS